MKRGVVLLLVLAACSKTPAGSPATVDPVASGICATIRDAYGGDVAKYLSDTMADTLKLPIGSSLPASQATVQATGKQAADAIKSTCPEYQDAAKAWAQSKP